MDQPQPGAVLGHYKIIRRLGAGGMGIVYEAEDLKLGRHVALKLLSGAGDPAALDRFWREARAVSALNHPGICTLYEINETEQQPFLVMELLEGQSLERHQGSAVPLNRLIELGIQIADALDAAHHKGILHRDVKPANIFITKTGQVKILDFGLARFEETSSDMTDTGLSARHMITQPGSTLGTIAYMSPEQARGEVLDARSDVFSLGVVLYEMGTGTHPFNGTTTAIVFDKLLNYVPPTPASLNSELPAQFQSILSKALEKNRELRYQSAAEIRTDLWRLQRNTFGEPLSPVAISPPPTPQYEGVTRLSDGGVAVATAPPVTAVSTEATPNPLTAFDSAPAIPSLVAALRQATAPAPAKPPTKRPFLPVSLPSSLPLSPKHIRLAVVALAILAVVILAVALRPRHHQQRKAAVPAPSPAQTTAAATAPAPTPTPAPAATAPQTPMIAAKPASPKAAPKEASKPSAAHVATQNANVSSPPSATPNAVQQTPASPTTSSSMAAPPTSNAVAAPPVASKPSPAQPTTAPAAAATAPVFATVSYPARHEHAFPYLDGRSCSGTLELNATHLIFNSDTHPISLTRDDVTAVEGNGIVDTAGKRYRFQIAGMNNRQVHDLLAKWFSAGEATQSSSGTD
ncbi:MAG TPA: protein kinase [Acidobacteriaceae bacterium]|nr:protein kinase [Acidobacteriaceae bacterium]